MKAWIIQNNHEAYSEVVFAETRGKAKAIAMWTDTFSEDDFTSLEARRLKVADKYYKEGKLMLDWDNPQDRIVLVKECSFYCEYTEPYICEACSAKEYCEVYQEDLTEKEGDE